MGPRADPGPSSTWSVAIPTELPGSYLHISCRLILLLPWSTGLDPRLVLVRFVVGKVALGQCSVRTLRISLVRITPLMLRIFPLMFHTHLYPVTYLTARASGENLRAFKQSEFFSDVEQRWTKEKVFHIVFFQTLEHFALFSAVNMCLYVLVLPLTGVLLIATS